MNELSTKTINMRHKNVTYRDEVAVSTMAMLPVVRTALCFDSQVPLRVNR